ncbi:MAG: flagellar biosynthesis repressor FlbT [Parvularculaceae bacterium]
MALKLSLKPGERVAINGAVIVNGDRRSSIVVENKASVLREQDIMQPEDADTPAKRIYLPIMLMYLDARVETDMRAEYSKRLMEFAEAITDKKALDDCLKLAAHVANGDYYKALVACRDLMAFEEKRLANVA